MKLLKEIKTKITTGVNKVMTSVALIPLYVMTATNNVYAADDLSGWYDDASSVKEMTAPPSAGKLLGGTVSLIGTVAMVAGLFMILGGAISFFQARANDNSAGESKAGMFIGVGFMLMLVKVALIPLFFSA